MAGVSEGKIVAAERGLARRFREGSVGGGVDVPGGAEHVVYIDGSVSRQRLANGLGWMTGWGFVTTLGRYGCGKCPQFELRTGDDPAVVAELRAVWHAAGEDLVSGLVTVVTDSAYAADVLAGWQAGETAMPAGYTGSRRGTPTLQRLRQVVAADPGNLTVRWVKGHAGDALNEAADTLAQLGMRWARDGLTADDVAVRARGVAEGFLAASRRADR